MSTDSLKDAKASVSSIIEQAAAGEFVAVIRDGQPATDIVSAAAADGAARAPGGDRPSLAEYLATFPADIDVDDEVFARNPAPSREVSL